MNVSSNSSNELFIRPIPRSTKQKSYAKYYTTALLPTCFDCREGRRGHNVSVGEG